MMSQSGRRGPIVMLAVLVFVSFVLMTFDIRSSGKGLSGTLRSGTQTIFSPVQRLAQTIVVPINDTVESLADLAGLRDENVRLREENETLVAQLAEAESLRLENEQLKTLVNLDTQLDEYGLTFAQVLSGAGTGDLGFTIDLGLDDGIVEDSPVLDGTGSLVGRVADVSANTATVIPIVAAREAVAVETEAGDLGILYGQGVENALRLEIYEAVNAVIAGTVLRTFRDDRYPDGLNVATVTSDAVIRVDKIETDDVEPFADFLRLRFVAIVNVPGDEPPPEQASPSEGDS